MNSDKEQRYYYRMMLDAPVEIKTDDNVSYGTCRDVSATGGLLIAEKSFNKGDEITLLVETIGLPIPKMTIKGVVLRSDSMECGMFKVAIAVS